MSFKEKFSIGKDFAKALVLRKRMPLIVGWNITYRCNLRCNYCGVHDIEMEELDTVHCFEIIDELEALGTRFINFSGGEPLLREDLGRLIEYCSDKDISVSVNTNGTLVVDRWENIRHAGEVQISLDGPRKINNLLRGNGVHDHVIEAMAKCCDENLPITISTVISKYNLNHLDYVLDVAGKYKAGVFFQPLDQTLSTDCQANIEASLAPEKDRYRDAIEELIEERKSGNSYILNSIAGLKHLKHWPENKKITCLASLLHCNIQPDGNICLCDMYHEFWKYQEPAACSDSCFETAFRNIEKPFPCNRCWSGGMVEFNLMGSMKLSALQGLWERYKNEV